MQADECVLCAHVPSDDNIVLKLHVLQIHWYIGYVYYYTASASHPYNVEIETSYYTTSADPPHIIECF